MLACANCSVHACESGRLEKLPPNCPMRDRDFFDQVLTEYGKEENHEFFVNCSGIEALGYCRWPRLREVAEFAKRMGYTHLGMGFCGGLKQEAAIVERVLRQQGFQVTSVICKAGAIPKGQAGIPPQLQLGRDFEPMCNPIAQAQLLNRAGTQFNICLGLCVGHDSLFYKYCDAPVTTLVAKDRVTGNNPAAAIYCADGYFRDRLTSGQD